MFTEKNWEVVTFSDIKFRATVDSKKGEVSLSQLDKGVTKVEKSAKKAGAGFKSLAVGVAAGIAAFAVASKALRGLVRWMGDAVDKAAIQQTAEKEVAAALESTGREVEANVEHFKEYASELQNATTYGDEQILSAQALMIQLTRLDQEGLDAATKGAIGLASVYKTDLQAATTLVGKALAGNYGALSRYGIMVERTATDEQKRASILKQLQTMYQRAEADTDTYAGSVKQLSNTYGDLKEEVGKAVTENEDFRDIIKTVTQTIRDLIDSGYLEYLVDLGKEIAKNMEYFVPFAEALKIIALKMAINAAEARKLKEEDEALREEIGKIVGDIRDFGDVVDQAGKKVATLSLLKIDWEALKPPSELMADWETLFALVETPELDLAFEQFAISAEDNFASVMESMGFFVEESEEKAEQYKEIMGKMTEAQKEFSAIALGELMNMEAGLKGMVDAILNTFEKWALGAVVKSTMTLPFPANLIASAVAMAAVKAIFAEIKGMEKGGWVGLHGPEIIKVGERGPEYVTSNSQINNVYNQREGNRAVFNLYITTPGGVNAEQLFNDMEREARRRGYSLNG